MHQPSFYEFSNPLPHVVLLALCLLITPSAMAKDWLYTVKPGDTLWDLCLTYTNHKKCWLEVSKYNGVDYPPSLAPGTRIRFPVAWLKAQPAPANIAHIKGQVFVIEPNDLSSGGSGEETRPAVEGDSLPMGSQVITHENSFATLRFADGATLVLEPLSRIEMDTLTHHQSSGMVNSRLHLLKGAAKSLVPKRQPKSNFSITTPSAIAAVRGTEFRVSTDNEVMSGEVFEGDIDVAKDQKQKVSIPENYGIRVADNTPLGQPVKLLDPVTFTTQQEAVMLTHRVQWQVMPGAANYKVELLADGDTDEVLSLNRQAEAFWQLALTEPACVRVRVSAIAENGLQGMPAQQKLCAAAPLTSPQTLSHKGKVLSWKALDAAQGYRVEFSETADFSTVASQHDVTEPQFPLTREQHHLFARVYPLDAQSRQGEASAVYYIRTQNTEGIIATLGFMLLLILL